MPGISHFNPPELPQPRGYSHASSGSGDLVFVAGQTGTDGSGRIVDPGDLPAQFGAAVRNLKIALDTADCQPDDVVKLVYYVTDLAAYRTARETIGKHYQSVFGRHFPASTLVEVSALVDPEAMVEIEAVAVRS